MSKTTIEHFNNYLKLFVQDIIVILPEYKENLELYYDELLGDNTCNDDKYVKRFIRKTDGFKDLITNRDDSLFNDTNVLKTIDFKELWKKDISQNSRNKIWEYIQTLFVLGETIMSDTERVQKLVDNIKNINNENNENNETNEGDMPELSSEDRELLNTIKNLSENKNTDIDEDFIENSLIGNLAKELSEDIDLTSLNIDENDNPGDVFSNMLSGENPMKFMNLIQKVGEKINNKVTSGDLNQSDLITEAGKMMGALGGNNPLFGDLMKNMPVPNQNQQNQSHNNPTRDRLRKKLEKRNNK